jgi:YteA family regulatory protein
MREGGPDPAEVRAALARRKRELVGTLRGLSRGDLAESLREGLGELSTYDNHPADLGTETWKRSQEMAVAGLLEQSLAEVEAAERRLEEGRYGVCERCGRAIPAERLQARPEARFCIRCQREVEAETSRAAPQRPVEEDLLEPPFGRGWKDGTGWVGQDAEDVWQDAARAGTSETPADVPGARRYPGVYVDSGEERGTVQGPEGLSAPPGAGAP